MKTNRFTTIPGLHLPEFGKAELTALLELTEEFAITRMRFTPSNQLAVAGLNEQDLPVLTEQLKTFMKSIESKDVTVLSCQGCQHCSKSVADAAQIVQRITEVVLEDELPAKCKIAVASCARCCTMPFVRDLGLVPSPSGWKVIFGGNGGGNPRIGDVIAEKVDNKDLFDLVTRCFSIYRQHAQPKQRTSRFIEAFGVDRFKNELLSK